MALEGGLSVWRPTSVAQSLLRRRLAIVERHEALLRNLCTDAATPDVVTAIVEATSIDAAAAQLTKNAPAAASQQTGGDMHDALAAMLRAVGNERVLPDGSGRVAEIELDGEVLSHIIEEVGAVSSAPVPLEGAAVARRSLPASSSVADFDVDAFFARFTGDSVPPPPATTSPAPVPTRALARAAAPASAVAAAGVARSVRFSDETEVREFEPSTHEQHPFVRRDADTAATATSGTSLPRVQPTATVEGPAFSGVVVERRPPSVAVVRAVDGRVGAGAEPASPEVTHGDGGRRAGPAAVSQFMQRRGGAAVQR